MNGTRYEMLIAKSEQALQKAQEAQDVNMKAFLYRVSKGYKERARCLTVEEAEQVLKGY